METDWKIDIDDGSSSLSSFTSDQNNKFVELYNWQQRAIDYFLEKKKVVFNVSTGAGKSFCTIQIIKEILKKEPNLRVLIVVPKNVILEDTWIRELTANGFTIRDVGVFYGNIKEYSKITITNMQNLERINMDIFDMLVLDECFSGNTEIICENNKIKKLKNIVDKKEKIKVLSYNINTKKLEYKKISNWYKIKEKREVLDIKLENGKILTVTPEQLIFNGEKYIKACDLKTNDKILSL